MNIERKLRRLTGVLLILMFASSAQAATVVLDKTDFMRGTKTDLEFLVPSDVSVPAILKGIEIVGAPCLTSVRYKFQANPVISTPDVNKVAGGGSVLSMPRLSDFGLSRLKLSDEPVPAIAILILVGLIALIAMKGRRK